MTIIRTMHEKDLAQVIEIEAAAFGTWYKQLHGEEAELPPRTLTNVQSCLAKDPAGCFVAEQGDRLVGFILSRTWGGVGWFGTFSVLTEHQGRGIGKQLIGASLGYLHRQPDRLIGLSTMPESPYNLGLYLKMGFQVHRMTLFLAKSLQEPPSVPLSLPRWSQASAEAREGWLADLRQASGRIYPGLDYSKEILVTDRYHQGETIILAQGDRALGMAVVWLAPSRQGQESAYGNTQVLALDPVHTDADTFRTLLGGAEALVHAHGMDEIVVPVNTQHAWALEQLLRWDYRVVRAMVRMVLPEPEARPGTDHHVNLVRWAG